MTELSKPVLGPAFLDSEMLQEHVAQEVLSLPELVTAVIGAPGFLFAHLALKFEFTGHQTFPTHCVVK